MVERTAVGLQQRRAGCGLPAGPTLDLVVYEAINFMDGKRTNPEIAELLSADMGAISARSGWTSWWGCWEGCNW